MTRDNRWEAGRQRRAAAAREGRTARTFAVPQGRNRGIGKPQPPATMSVAEALDLLGSVTVDEARAQLEQEG